MWSLGCVIAELFLGWPLYPGASEYDQVRAHGRCGNVQMKLQWSAFGPSEANVSYIKFHLVQITVVWHLKFIFPLWYSHCLFLLYREPKEFCVVWHELHVVIQCMSEFVLNPLASKPKSCWNTFQSKQKWGVCTLAWNALCNFTMRAVFPCGDRASPSFLFC